MMINNLKITSNNGSKAQAPTIRVSRDGVLLARVEFDAAKRASDPLSFVRKLYVVDEYANEKRKELVEKLAHAGVEQEVINELLWVRK